MELKDHKTPKKPCSLDLRVCCCCASHFQTCYDTLNIFGRIGVKENLAAKLKQIGEIEVFPDCEEALPTKICRNFSIFLFALRACAVRSK